MPYVVRMYAYKSCLCDRTDRFHLPSIYSSLQLCLHLYRLCVTLEKSPPLAAMMILCPTTRLET